jgi:hypothetical protein
MLNPIRFPGWMTDEMRTRAIQGFQLGPWEPPPTGQHRVKSLNRVSLALHESVTLECFRAFAFGGITLL